MELCLVFICLMIDLQGGGIGVLEEGYVGLLIFYRKGGECFPKIGESGKGETEMEGEWACSGADRSQGNWSRLEELEC